jgi:hypothetical protein
MNATLKAALIRSARTAGQAFVGVILAKWIVGPTTVSGLIDVVRLQADFAGGSAILAALTALGVNAWKPVTPEVAE